MLASTAQLDTDIEVVTPENIAFRYRVAGPFRRLLAFVIDLLIRIALWVAFGLATMFIFAWVGLVGVAGAAWLILGFLLYWFYGGLLETYWNGQTVGKWA